MFRYTFTVTALIITEGLEIDVFITAVSIFGQINGVRTDVAVH